MGSKRHKGNRWNETFIGFPSALLNSKKFVSLSAHAAKLLFDVAAQYRGDNNGDLSVAWKLMKPRGWRSEDTLNKAKRELLEAEFIFETRKGHRPNVCSLFALTWRALDDGTKFDAGARTRFWPGAFRDPPAAPLVVIHHRNAAPTTPVVAERAA